MSEDSPTMSPAQPTKSLCYYLSLVTVEPTMVLYMMAFMTTSVVEQAFFVNKACRVNHGLNETVCDNLSNDNYTELHKQVQVTVSDFHLWNDIGSNLVPIVLAMFMGAWSDKHGRKLPILIGLVGKLYYSSLIVINSMQPTWPLEYVIYTATIPMAMTGADVAIFASAYTYLIDITSQVNRTFRVTLLEVCYLATMPLGTALGSFLFEGVANKSFEVMFGINVSLLIAAIVYSSLRLKMRTNNQTQISRASNMFADFFDLDHLRQTVITIYKKRQHNRRLYLHILLISMALYTFQRDEKNMMYLYTQLIFDWDKVKDFSTFKIVQSSVQDCVLLLLVPLMSRVLGLRDTVIIMIGALAHSIARIFYATALNSSVFYVGGVLAAFGPIVAPVIRSMVSKIVATSEKGKAFSVLSVADNAIPLISGTCYSKLYNWTIHSHPNSIFFLTMATQMGVFLLILIVHLGSKDEQLVHDEEYEDEQNS